jgi:hypothetical protein
MGVGATHAGLENCRGNPLWLPKIMGRHGGLPLQGYVPMHGPNDNIRQTNCRGNPLWLPKIMGRHGGLPYKDMFP